MPPPLQTLGGVNTKSTQVPGAQTVPAESAVQVPSANAPVQLRHLVSQSLPQHLPSTQVPDLHSWLVPQATPGSFFG